MVYQNFIDGRSVPSSSGDTFENRNPADTDDLIGIFQQSTAADVDAAIAAAARAYDRWRLVPAPLRAEILFKAAPGSRPDFSGRDLSFLDLSDLDFKEARLAGANLLGANLSGANLARADLQNAKLDRTHVARTNFSGAKLSGASLYDVVGSLNFDAPAANAPNFEGADLSGARMMARLSRANMRGTKLTEARLGPPERGNELKTPKQTDLSGAILTGADLRPT